MCTQAPFLVTAGGSRIAYQGRLGLGGSMMDVVLKEFKNTGRGDNREERYRAQVRLLERWGRVIVVWTVLTRKHR